MGKSLIAILGAGKGTWGHVGRLIAEEEWEKIFLVSSGWGRENFKPAKPAEWIITNSLGAFELVKNEISSKLPSGGELAVSMISGSGKEHVALLAALKEKKLAYSLVLLTAEGTRYY
ncbi:MAG: hypothetical protein HY917_00325 [Candidatus Diapherotrites archaeon]|nr:hypothetical protein [Candidatus Diapherotrites archaeon]